MKKNRKELFQSKTLFSYTNESFGKSQPQSYTVATVTTTGFVVSPRNSPAKKVSEY